MTDQFEVHVRIPLTKEQMKVLEDPKVKTFVEQEVSRVLRRDWEDQCIRAFLLGPNAIS